MSKIYCGAGDVPKGRKRGTMKQCIESGEIRYYGIHKVDPKLLKSAKDKKVPDMSLEKLKIEIVGLKSRKNKLIRQIKSEKNETKKRQQKDDAIAINGKLKKKIELYRQIEKKQSSGKKQGSRKSGSRRRKSSK